ncbi:hypothetical protein B0H16DRAFT_1891172 [Mycena metata]|uniref:Uncharacterized protein n=1 Tax=Mycena metata TaxID=1033252 RepID=A0AAD7IAV4_9AGAR|nr:hypothetical protein B0H16DRAFT_1891172 [Mycena metata]
MLMTEVFAGPGPPYSFMGAAILTEGLKVMLIGFSNVGRSRCHPSSNQLFSLFIQLASGNITRKTTGSPEDDPQS